MIVLLGLGCTVTALPERRARSSWPENHVSVTAALGDRVQKRPVQAGDSPLCIGGFRFRIVRVGFDSSAMGFVPADMSPKERLIFVECELLSGNRYDFKNLEITLSSGSGQRSKAVVLISGGMMKALSSLTIADMSYSFQPENENIAWAYVVQESESDFFLTFPAGEVISLAPFIRRIRSTPREAAAVTGSSGSSAPAPPRPYRE